MRFQPSSCRVRLPVVVDVNVTPHSWLQATSSRDGAAPTGCASGGRLPDSGAQVGVVSGSGLPVARGRVARAPQAHNLLDSSWRPLHSGNV